MDLNEIHIFTKVVELGSFTKAARALGMPNSTVSAKVASLEARLGTTLIQRTTRRLVVTPAGANYYGSVKAILEDIAVAELELVHDRSSPRGVLRVTAPVELGNSVLPRLFAEYTRTYPEVSVEAHLTDRRVHLMEEGVDLALRAGELEDSSLIAKSIASVAFGIYGSPAYLAGRAVHAPEDLAALDAVGFTPFRGRPWTLRGPSGETLANCRSRYTANDLNLVKSLARQGVGLALLPTFFCTSEISERSLVRVLPDWATAPAPLHFVYTAQKFVPPRVTAFISLATPILRSLLKP